MGLLLAALVACDAQPAPEGAGGLTEEKRQALLGGYELLADTLKDESRLGKLEFLKKLTLDAPNDAIGKLMNTLSDASDRRASELEELRQLAPNVSDKPKQESPIGNAITAIAKDFGKSEMLSRDGGFDVRFVLLQAQATRMVAAMSTALARFNPNPRRKGWLKRLANEYEGYRGDMMQYVMRYQAAK